MAGRKYGLDLGSMHLKISHGGQGIVINEKNMIAIQRKKDMVAAGNQAYDMFERTPDTIRVWQPVSHGVISDIQLQSRLTEAMLRKAGCVPGFIHNNSFYLAVPSDVTEVEKRAFFDLIGHSAFNTRRLHIIERPLAAAVGEHLPVKRNLGMMLVDMGAGATEISILTADGVSVSRLLRMGGIDINEQICQLVRQKHHLIIGYKTAEYLKLEMGSAIPRNSRSLTVYGRDRITGLPAGAEISQQLIFDAMKPYLLQVIETIRELIEKVPPEMMRDILNNGIYFTGGSTLIAGLDKVMSSALQVKVMMSAKPMESTVRGLTTIMDNPSEYKNMIFSLGSRAFE